MSFRIVIRTRNRWIYWNQTFLGLVMPNSAWHNINKKSWNIMIKLGGHVLRSPGRSTWSLWSWSRCQMKNTLEIFIISKDRVLSLINCRFTSRRILQTLRMWFSGSNFGCSLPYKHSNNFFTKPTWHLVTSHWPHCGWNVPKHRNLKIWKYFNTLVWQFVRILPPFQRILKYFVIWSDFWLWCQWRLRVI